MRRRRRVAVLGPLAACALIAGAGCDSDGIETDEPEATFAPLVLVSADEKWPPMSAERFLSHSVFWFAQRRPCSRGKIAVGRALRAQRNALTDWLLPAGLGRGPVLYKRDQLGRSCDFRGSRNFFADQQTRPYDGVDRAPGLTLPAGFYLDLLDSARRGPARPAPARVAAPAYVEQRSEDVEGEPGVRLTYWMLYGMGEAPGLRGQADRLTHEGDWERIDVLLQEGDGDGEYVPKGLRLYVGNGQREIPWNSVELTGQSEAGGTHPVVVAARGSHTPSAAAGCRDCSPWRTWAHLRPARTQPWYGFGGAWGERGNSSETTGPHGPYDGKWGIHPGF